jgi:hypothetical protein
MITMDTEAALVAEFLAVGGGNREAVGRDENKGKSSGCDRRTRE